MGLFKDGFNSIGFRRVQLDENIAYAETLCNDINSFLSSSCIKVSATVYDVQLNDPLNLVILHFGEKTKEISRKSISELKAHLQAIDKYMIHKKAPSIYVRKHIIYYDNDTVYLIKPNQKRFWSKSQAMEDATSLIADIINMTK